MKPMKPVCFNSGFDQFAIISISTTTTTTTTTILLFIYLSAELNSQWPITESAHIFLCS
jgi:hypothetical protein